MTDNEIPVVKPGEPAPDHTLQTLVHLCHVKDWELSNGDITNGERMLYYEDLVKYVRFEMKHEPKAAPWEESSDD